MGHHGSHNHYHTLSGLAFDYLCEICTIGIMFAMLSILV